MYSYNYNNYYNFWYCVYYVYDNNNIMYIDAHMILYIASVCCCVTCAMQDFVIFLSVSCLIYYNKYIK